MVDYTAVGACLIDMNYDKAVSLEIPPLPDAETAASMGLSWMQSIWNDSPVFIT